MTFRTIPNDRLIDGGKLDLISVTNPINLDNVATTDKLDEKVDKTTTVNGKELTNNITLNTDDIPEGVAKYDKVVSLLASNGISVTGTYPNFTVENTSPDQVVSLTEGTGITITGTYPNFTISATGDTTVSWGDIEGTLSNQLDLQNALDDKADADSVYTKGETDTLLSAKANDNEVVHLTGNETIAGTKVFSSEVKITDGDGEVNVRENIVEQALTGIEDGLFITRIDATTFSVSSGIAQFTNTSVTPHTYLYTNFTGGTYTNSFLYGENYIYLNQSGAIVQRNTEPTTQLTNDECLIGVIVSSNGTQIADSPRGIIAANAGVLLQELARKEITTSVTLSPNANLTFNATSGTFWRVGVSYSPTNKRFTNELAVGAQTPQQFSYTWRNGTGGWSYSSLTSNVLPTRYDDGTGGATQPNGAVSTTRYSIQPIYKTGNNYAIVQYGQTTYGTITQAKDAIGVETRVLNPLLNSQALLGYLIVRSNTTNLQDTAYALWIPASQATGGGGSGGGDMTAAVYDPAGIAQQVVGTTATQTISNKTIALGSNTLSGTLAQFNTAITDADIVPTSTTITINGITYDLSANRSWTITTGGSTPDFLLQSYGIL